MIDIYLTNSLTRKKEKFVPINQEQVGMYTCGPTVYDYSTIGNLRTYTTADILLRVLKYAGHKVFYVMNLTDVGHLTGDNLGDADIGEDRLEKAAKKEGKTAWDIAKYYSEVFVKEMGELNLLAPDVLPKATEHIKEQVDLISKLEEKGFTYKTSDGIYFDTKVFEEKTKKKYGGLSTLDKIKEGARVEKNPEKKNSRDFALWKFSYDGGRSFDEVYPEHGRRTQDDVSLKRHMEWESPWGIGFPGWHIECSAMSMKYLGESFDIHVGGEDLRSTHHPNEIAQSEAVTNKQFARYWLHGTFLRVDGKRMGKSVGNAYTLKDIEEKGFEPLSLRYLYLTAHYKDSLNFTWNALTSAQNALNNLRKLVQVARSQTARTTLSDEKRKKVDDYSRRFQEAMSNDINTPQALAVLWEATKSNIPSEDKYDLAISFDEVFGLKLGRVSEVSRVSKVPSEVKKLVEKRENLRKEGKFKEADEIRQKIYDLGFMIEDKSGGTSLKKKK